MCVCAQVSAAAIVMKCSWSRMTFDLSLLLGHQGCLCTWAWWNWCGTFSMTNSQVVISANFLSPKGPDHSRLWSDFASSLAGLIMFCAQMNWRTLTPLTLTLALVYGEVGIEDGGCSKQCLLSREVGTEMQITVVPWYQREIGSRPPCGHLTPQMLKFLI